MQYRRLGRAGAQASTLGLGTWLTFAADPDGAARLVDTAIDAGITLFDTANTDGRGTAETVLGQALARHDREPLVIATKVWGRTGEGPNRAGLSRKHLRSQCDASLRRLGVEYLDLYQCQRYDPETSLEETMRALDDLVHAGKILYWGVSGWSPTELDNAMRLADAHGLHGPVTCQVRLNLLEQGALANTVPAARQHGLGVLAYSPLAQGVLTGKYRESVPPGSRLADERAGRNLRQRYGELVAGPTVTTLVQQAEALGVPPATLALAWVIDTPGVTAALCGATTPEQLAENARAAELALDPGIRSRLEAAG